ncbi:MAG TPA: hypothetical protein VGO86_06215 [Candidatus Dormibacteraeota bacterium]|jgi:multidrug resistance efflux pump
MNGKVLVDRGEMDRLVLMRIDLDRYEAQLIPDLQQEVLALRHALRRLVEAVQEAEAQLGLEASKSHRGALREAQRMLTERSGASRNQPADTP